MSIVRTVSTDLNPHKLRIAFGEYNKHLKYIQERLQVQITHRQDKFIITGDLTAVERSEFILGKLIELADEKDDITGDELHLIVQSSLAREHDAQDSHDLTAVSLRTRKGKITPRGSNQQRYVKKILASDISFGVGPAGTGKTYLAVACAVDMLERGEIERILLVRPAVEAGEKLGFLPGDLTQKIDPYLRPLYDALYEMLGFEKVGKLLERQVIEVAPLAYMRGRTLNNSFVILDEAQNTTPEQMKMFLTRLGFGSRAVITGDMTQVDLPRGHQSGLAQAIKILSGIEEIHITRFDSKDVVRHHLVQKIVQAYDAFDEAEQISRANKKSQQAAKLASNIEETDDE
ncbi:phosphate starvation-inducible protein PhoH [Moraxella cuniculi DSM 21768]|uniref:PhoH-like protein n=1 Tax=Moraxella cuniculi DSM 21768 TaxID=1122245 RepID=A0A1N7EMR7_9GAMM|nr:PhoH family protein [Moraxella cuniculi]OOS07743.1 PhoH family protein [Moraxella cuniculi]SIR89366.1 phosphate starvation-inducible protein PhoH [Moraxella cuniculi DSM 21768]